MKDKVTVSCLTLHQIPVETVRLSPLVFVYLDSYPNVILLTAALYEPQQLQRSDICLISEPSTRDSSTGKQTLGYVLSPFQSNGDIVSTFILRMGNRTWPANGFNICGLGLRHYMDYTCLCIPGLSEGNPLLSGIFRNSGSVTQSLLFLHYYPREQGSWADMGPTWEWQGPDGPHVGPMNLVIRDHYEQDIELPPIWDDVMLIWHHCNE